MPHAKPSTRNLVAAATTSSGNCSYESAAAKSAIWRVSLSILLQDLLGDLGCNGPVVIHRFLAVVLQSVVLFHRKKVLRCPDAVFSEPFGFNVETPGRLTHCFAVDLLSLFAQQPVDEYLGGAGMRRCLDDRQCAAAAARVRPLFNFRERLDRQSGFNERHQAVIGQTDRQRNLSFGKTIAEQSLVARQQHILRGQFLQEVFPFDLEKKGPGRGSAASRAWV